MESSRFGSPTKLNASDEAFNYKEQITRLNETINLLVKDKLQKDGQLKNSDSQLRELQSKILETNQEIKKLSSIEIAPKSDALSKYAEDRDMQEIDKKLKEKLKEIAMKKLPLIPNKIKSIKDFKKEENNLMLIHTVKIRYIKGLKDGEIQKLEKPITSQEMSVRLLRSTVFKELKDLACKFWELDETVYSLRAYNYAAIEHIDDPVEKFIKDQKMRPELWLIHSDIEAIKSLTPADDYYTEGASKDKMRKSDNRAKKGIDKEGRIANYKSFLNYFEGMKSLMPETSLIVERHEEIRLESWELNIFTLIIALFLFLLTVIIHYNMGDFSTRYWISYQLQTTLKYQDAQ